MLSQINEQVNTDILVENIISNGNQSFLAPEIVFINKPYTINKNSYFKMLVSLNLNPNMVDVNEYKKNYSISNLDFKLYNSDLKEIKATSTIAKNYEINNRSKIFFEFEIPISIKEEHAINLSFGFSHEFKEIKYKSKGFIKINPTFHKVDNEININLINYLTYYDIKNEVKKWTSDCILSANLNLNFNQLEVNKYYKNFAEITISFNEENQHLINNNKVILEEIQQAKNNKIFPHLTLEDFKINNENDFKNYYSGKITTKLVEKENSFWINYEGLSVLDEKTKKVLLNEGLDGLYINPYNWNLDQWMVMTLNIFGETFTFNSAIKSYNKYQFIDNLKFNIHNSKKFTYKFDKSFWAILILLNAEEIKEMIKDYEIF
ncbi:MULTISPECIES: hypothetical protein [Mesoplasma]|uniref:Uncharacterized protein n=1 Tax=Mesoplasma florum TaxID=2151 RepID=A0A2R3P839_MESFO|nr:MULTISPECIES: hypothetical protein [Mesoplasma]AVN64655.1 hypothetical protein CG003_03270 [Mesoplasma florum]